MHEIWHTIRPWISERKPFALAVVVDTVDSTPRQPGAVLAIEEGSDRFIGSVSSGCAENDVIEMGRKCMVDGESQYLEYGSDEAAAILGTGLTCGGSLKVRVDPFRYDDLVTSALIEVMDDNEGAVWLRSGTGQALVRSDASSISSPDAAFSPETLHAAHRHLLDNGLTLERSCSEGTVLFHVLREPNRLFIIGAVDITAHLIRFCEALAFLPVVIDPRDAYANPERFRQPPRHLLCEWPRKALDAFEPGPSDFALVLTHDTKIDDQALDVLLRGECGYIGALGSSKSHQARLHRLRELGHDESSLQRIHGPVGIKIGSKASPEIALSIIAEMVKVRNDCR